jgi:hypothetical protein
MAQEYWNCRDVRLSTAHELGHGIDEHARGPQFRNSGSFLSLQQGDLLLSIALSRRVELSQSRVFGGRGAKPEQIYRT